MAIFKSYNDLVISWIEYLRLVQPELDTKPGTVSRDVFIDAPAQQVSDLYSQVQSISGLQSMFSLSGTDLNRWAANYGANRINGGTATGTVVFTTNNMDSDILIENGSMVTARNGVNFKTQNDILMASASSNVYRATALRLRSDLDLALISDEFAVEVPVQALTAGISGNLGRFAVISNNILGISNVTNLSSFSGGSDAESDDNFRTRILSIFAGSNTGTSLGYTTAIGVISGILDSEIVVPGNPLLIRDGTQVTTNSAGDLVVTNPGSGGKVDIYILGTDLDSEIDSFIYNDQSGKTDPTDQSNDFILGQKNQDSTLNAAQRRVTLIASNDLPNQPVESVISVAGSSSGSNFVEKYTDTDGSIRGNFELEKDSGDFGGSPFGFDKLKWISNNIELDDESVTKGIFNGTDSINFTDVGEIRAITQDYFVTNENSITSTTDRSSVTLRHTPARSVSRIVNLTTGERYVVEDQNPDGAEGSLNTTGKITISGSTLPVGTDVVQVDYTWVKPFDRKFDFDNLGDYSSTRTIQDSVDWGHANLVKNESSVINDDAYGTVSQTVTLTHPVFKVLSINEYDTEVSTVSDGAVTVSKVVSNIIDIRRNSDGVELFNTDARDGTLSGTTSIVLPTDSIAVSQDAVTVRFNATDVFDPDGYDEGAFEGSVVTLSANVSTSGRAVLVNYIADVLTLIDQSEISLLPFTKSDNKFLINGIVSGEQPTSNVVSATGAFTKNLRRAGSNIRLTVASSATQGVITIAGVTTHRVVDALVVVTAGSGFEVDLRPAILSDNGASSLSSSIKVSKLVNFERVNLNNTNTVTSVDNAYDVANYYLKDNSYDLERALKDTTLTASNVKLPQTTGNVAAQLNTGDVIRVTFYYVNTNDSEQLYFSKNGTQITDKVFSDISRVSLSSGFKNSSGVLTGNITVSNFNQPLSNTSYEVDYDYVAPKENERITVTFSHNSLPNSATTAIERVRPITADVLVKQAVTKTIDVSIKIILLPAFTSQEQTVVQDAISAVSAFLNASSLGTTVDASDVVNHLYSVSGIDRVQIINFSFGSSGNLLSITAERNEYLDAGTVTIEVEER